MSNNDNFFIVFFYGCTRNSLFNAQSSIKACKWKMLIGSSRLGTKRMTKSHFARHVIVKDNRFNAVRFSYDDLNNQKKA